MKTIFFDWGGVIANDPGDDFLRQLVMKYGAKADQVSKILSTNMKKFMKGLISEEEFWQSMRVDHGLSIPKDIAGEFLKWDGLSPNYDVINTASELKDKGWQIAVLSNVIKPSYELIKKNGYYDYFDQVIASCETGFAKPQLEIYQIALKRMNTTASEAVFIDDKQRNLDVAKNIGFKVILATSPKQIISDLRSLIE